MSGPVNRRSFLEGSLVTGAAAVVASAHVGADDSSKPRTVRIGIMGLSRGASLMQTFASQPGVEIKYLCDVDAIRADAAAKRLLADKGQAAEPIGDFHVILEDPEIDALVCAAPNHWHAPATILACNAGKHVYVEKPCSHNPWEGELMVEAARKANKAVQMGSQRRSSPAFQQAVQLLREGVIGKVYLSRSWYNNLRGSIGVGQPADPPEHLNYELWQGPAPRQPYVDNRLPYNWHWLWHWGNGELGNNGVHALDICRWGLGAEYPQRVTSSGGRYRYQDDQETPDTHVVAFEFPNGTQATWQGLSCNKHPCDSGFVAFYGEEGRSQSTATAPSRCMTGPTRLCAKSRESWMTDCMSRTSSTPSATTLRSHSMRKSSKGTAVRCCVILATSPTAPVTRSIAILPTGTSSATKPPRTCGSASTNRAGNRRCRRNHAVRAAAVPSIGRTTTDGRLTPLFAPRIAEVPDRRYAASTFGAAGLRRFQMMPSTT
ncbi:MAG: Gfo/Idh/MocA family oxidoreductase [Planctomycetaceae bacterium]